MVPLYDRRSTRYQGTVHLRCSIEDSSLREYSYIYSRKIKHIEFKIQVQVKTNITNGVAPGQRVGNEDLRFPRALYPAPARLNGLCNPSFIINFEA